MFDQMPTLLGAGSVIAWARDPLMLVTQIAGAVVVLALFNRLEKRLRHRLSNLKPVPLNPAQLPADVREYFSSQHQGLLELGFTPAGDYQMVHGREPCYTRFYLSREGDVYAEVELYRMRPKEFRVVVFGSVFDDGTVLYTGDLEAPAQTVVEPPPQMLYRYRPGIPVSEQLRLHLEDAAEYAERKAVQVLEYPPDQLAEVSAYYTQYQRDYYVDRHVIQPPERQQPAMG